MSEVGMTGCVPSLPPCRFDTRAVKLVAPTHPFTLTRFSPRAFAMNLSTSSLMAAVFALCTALFWGTYGPLLSRGHHLMGTEGRLRPFICVGIAYLLVAIVGPIVVMYTTGIDKGNGLMSGWTFNGVVWSVLAGGVGALGAFTLIMALGAGGPSSPVYVMPLVFGCAPAVSAFTSMYLSGNYKISPFFAAGLILVAVGAVTILITAPRPGRKPTHDDHAAKAAGTKSVFDKPDAKSYAAPNVAAESASDAAQVAAGEAKSADDGGKSDNPDGSWSEPEKA